MPKRKQNYKQEYARRVARGKQKELSRWRPAVIRGPGSDQNPQRRVP